MLNENICGTYWAIRLNGSGQIPKNEVERTYLWLVQGDKPTKSQISYIANYTDRTNDMLWLRLESGSFTFKGSDQISADDFLGLKFPDVLVEDGPVQIEICKSGKVYYYE